jgi:hypothetical protein
LPNFTRVSYETCAWHECGRLWVRHRDRKGVTCSRSCGLALWHYRRALAQPIADATVDGVHDTELCAWWEPPYCSRIARKRDLCDNHYATAHRRKALPPIVFRRSSSWHGVAVDSGGTTRCLVCGPITRLLGDGRCSMSQREYVLRQKYGLTQADYDERLIALGNRCAMCGKPPGTAGLVVDHSHAAGHPRDLICMPCNVLLGHIEADMDRIRTAMEYIDGHRTAGAFTAA